MNSMHIVIAFSTILTLFALNDFVDDVKYRWKMDEIIDEQKSREILSGKTAYTRGGKNG